MRALQIAGTGMMAQQTNVEVISNNIANMSTTGYKRRRAEFQDLIYQNLRRVGSQSSDTGSILPSGAQVGLGVLAGVAVTAVAVALTVWPAHAGASQVVDVAHTCWAFLRDDSRSGMDYVVGAVGAVALALVGAVLGGPAVAADLDDIRDRIREVERRESQAEKDREATQDRAHALEEDLEHTSAELVAADEAEKGAEHRFRIVESEKTVRPARLEQRLQPFTDGKAPICKNDPPEIALGRARVADADAIERDRGAA